MSDGVGLTTGASSSQKVGAAFPGFHERLSDETTIGNQFQRRQIIGGYALDLPSEVRRNA